jgi:hypothetical protein
MRNGPGLLAFLALLGAGCGERRESVPAPEPKAQIAEPSLEIRFPRVPGDHEEPAALPPAEPPKLGPEEYDLREYVDLTGRVAPFPARVNGRLWLFDHEHTVVVRIWTGRVLEGTVFKKPVTLEAKGKWRREGAVVIVDGLDLAIGDVEVFRPRGEARRWRIEREGDSLLVHADPFTFARPDSR